jgi:hypothetical protein
MQMQTSEGLRPEHDLSQWVVAQAFLSVGMLLLNLIPALVPVFNNPTPFLFASPLIALLALLLIYVGMGRILRMYRELGEVKDFGEAVNLTLQYIVGTEIIILLLAWMLSDILALL